MPTISQFYGISICMYYGEHAPPHFHVIFGEYVATFGICEHCIMEGNLPPRALKLVKEWAKIHQDELLHDWALCQRHHKPFEIEPLP